MTTITVFNVKGKEEKKIEKKSLAEAEAKAHTHPHNIPTHAHIQIVVKKVIWKYN